MDDHPQRRGRVFSEVTMSDMARRKPSKHRLVVFLLTVSLVFGGVCHAQNDTGFLADTDGDGTIDQVTVCQTNHICVSHPSIGTTDTYADPLWYSVTLAWVADTDGKPGAEIILVVTNPEGGVQCVCVIHDRAKAQSSYGDPLWRSVHINWVTDTDGKPGADIVLTYQSGSDQGLSVIHDRTRDVKTYPYSGQPITIQQMGDYDGQPGNEICVLVGKTPTYELITERTGEHTVIRDCTIHPKRLLRP